MKLGSTPSGHARQHGAAARIVLAVVALLVLAVVGWNWYQRHLAPPVIVATAPPAVAPTDGIPPPAAPASEPGVRYPLEGAASAPAGSASAPPADLTQAISALVGRAGRAMLQLGDFPRRFVATVDNLGRAHAPPLVWPVNPAPGRFTTTQRAGDSTVIAPSNRERYDALVQLIESIDVARAAALYRTIYPQLQEAYRQLGYPNAYFNDRFVEVIDQMLATPEVDPVAVQLTEVKGPVASTRPWVRYEFADPRLENLSAGQKILLRVGPEHRRRLKSKLVAVRAALTNPVARRP